jgi:hypothetical protein
LRLSGVLNCYWSSSASDGRAEFVVPVRDDRVRDGSWIAGLAWGEAGGWPVGGNDQHSVADHI